MLIPSVLALSEFFIAHFPNHFFWYPYWYLGNPYQYLIGPVVPLILTFLNKVFSFPVLQSYIALVFVSLLVGGAGVYQLVARLGGEKKESRYSGMLFLTLPFYALLLTVGNGLHHIAVGFLPWIVLLFVVSLNKKGFIYSILLAFSIAFALLIEVSILLPILIGFVCVAVAKRVEIKRIEYILIKIIFVLLLSLSLSTFWYTPDFWWTVLRNPSFGGLPLSNSLTYLFNLALNLLPIVLAVVFVKWRKIKLSPPLLFGLLFFSSFLFLTFFRFLSDPDFVMDWIGFLLELQLGGAIIMGSVFADIFGKKRMLSGVFYRGVVVLGIIVSFFIIRGLKNPINISYQERIVSMIKNNVGSGFFVSVGGLSQHDFLNEPRIFFSGTPVFWINYVLSVPQIRGGADAFSYHSAWQDGAYQIREGTKSDLANDWLKALGASYVVVHESISAEQFRDFKHPSKFSDNRSFSRVYENSGDTLYKVNGATLGRIADIGILTTQRPKNGADKGALEKYVSTFQKTFAIFFDAPNQFIFGGDIQKGEVISLAVTYHPSWKIIQGKGKIVSDSLGNMVIVPKNTGRQKFTLLYTNQPSDFILPGGLALAALFILLFFDKLYSYISKPLSRLSIGIHEKEEEY